jgi:hypothetical protein
MPAQVATSVAVSRLSAAASARCDASVIVRKTGTFRLTLRSSRRTGSISPDGSAPVLATSVIRGR